MIGPSLPYVLMYGAMTKSPDGRGVIIFGGVTSENYMEVHETNCGDYRIAWIYPCWFLVPLTSLVQMRVFPYSDFSQTR